MLNISRRSIFENIGTGITIVALLIIFSLSSCTTKEGSPNIIIIFTDDLGYADVGSYGAKGFETPHLDKMADEGIRFTDFHPSTAVCSASRASLLTGCYSERVSIRGALGPTASIGLNPQEDNIAKLLKRKNYKTGIFGKWHLGHLKQFLPLQQGFDEYFGLPYSNDMWPVGFDGKPITKGWKKGYPELKLYEGNETVETVRNLDDQSQLTTRYTERAVKFIEKNAKENFFLYLAHSMPHVPLGVSEKFKGKSEQGLYGDVIMEIDWSVGEILKTLKENNLDENTLVIFTSDNGPWLNFGNHGGSAFPLREGKGTMWEGGDRVPCIMRWPDKIKSNTISDNLVSTIDIFPTLAAITESKLPENKIDGINILPLLSGEENVNPRDEFWYYYDYDLIAVRKNEWKLYFPSKQRSYEGMEPGADGFPGKTWQREISFELYNLNEDVEEQNNEIDNYPKIVEELKKIGDKARYELGDRLRGIKGKENRDPGRIGVKRVKFNDHLAIGKAVELKYKPNSKYGMGNDSLIIDGWKGSLDYNDSHWLGFEATDFEAIIDLGNIKSVNSISASFLQNQNSWIFSPEYVELLISKDGKDFEQVASVKENIVANYGLEPKIFEKNFKSKNVRYIKIVAKNIKECPSWHKGKGGKAWIFVDEVIVE